MNALQQLIKNHLSDIKYSVADEDLLKYGTDWTDFYQTNPCIILFPKTTLEVQQIVQLANQHRIGIVPSGGRTGLSGGAVAAAQEIVVSLEYMNQILDFNPIDQTVRVQAGVITQAVQDFALRNNCYYPVDFGSRGSSQIGGNIATNAGGIRVIRYGLTRNWVVGLQVVTGTGDLLETNHGLLKNATGYDLRHLMIGSEGTLGIVTEAILQLTRPPQQKMVLFLAIKQVEDAMPILLSLIHI